MAIFLAKRQKTPGFPKTSGIIISLASMGLLVMRVVHGHVVFRSVGLGGNHEAMAAETIASLNEQYLRSLNTVFIFAAIAAVLSFCFIYFSFRFSKPSAFSTSLVMSISGVIGLAGGLIGILYGQNAGSGIPLAAAWAALAFGVMLVVGIAGLSKRRSISARAIWGFVQLVIFTFCMLQTVYYAYSAMVRGMFFNDGPFIWITALCGILAVCTPMSAFYISGIGFAKESAKKPVGE
jgi:hypothetical protein